MAHPDKIDADFTAFAQNGDPAALERVFDATSAELYRFALHLCGAPAIAEDAVQATWLAAIEGAGNRDPARPVMPWLTGILHNQVRAHFRRESVRQRPLDRGEPRSIDPALEAERAELSAALDAGIAQLSEVYGPVVKLHLRHGLNANAIAETLDRPAGTVRTQLGRGLDKLRELLPASLAGTAAALALPSRGLSAVRSAVLQSAQAARPIAIAGAAAGQGARILLAACLIVGAAAIAWFVIERGPTDAPTTPRTTTGESATTAATPRPARADSSDDARLRTPIQSAGRIPAAVVSPVTLTGRVVADADDIGLPDIEVLAFRETPTWSRTGWDAQPIARTRSDDSGDFSLSIAPGTFSLHAIGTLLATFETVAGTTGEDDHIDRLIVKLRPARSVRIRVLDPAGLPIRSQEISLTHTYGQGPSLRTQHAGVLRAGAGKLELVTGADGIATASLPERTSYSCTVVHRDFLRRAQRISFDSMAQVDIRLEAGETVTGRVLLPDGAPADNARIRLASEIGKRTKTDEHGDFTLRGVVTSSEKAYLSVRHADAAVRCLQPLPTMASPLTIRLDPPESITGIVRDERGQPIAGAVLKIVGDRRVETSTIYVGETTTWEWANGRAKAKTDQEGRFEFSNLYAGTFDLTVAKERLDRGAMHLTVRSDDPAPLDITLTDDAILGRVLRGRVVGAATAEPVAGAKLKMVPVGGGMIRTAETDDDGTWEFTGCDPNPMSLDITAAGFAQHAMQVDLSTADAPIEIGLRRPVDVTLRILEADGSPAKRARVRIDRPEGEPWMFQIGTTRMGQITADDAGVATMFGLPADLLSLTVQRMHEDDVTRTLDLRHGEDADITITLDSVTPTVDFEIAVSIAPEAAITEMVFTRGAESKRKLMERLANGDLRDPRATVTATLRLDGGRRLCVAQAALQTEPSAGDPPRTTAAAGGEPLFETSPYAVSLSYPGGGMRAPARAMPLPILQLRGRKTAMLLTVTADGYAPIEQRIDGTELSAGPAAQRLRIVFLTPE